MNIPYGRQSINNHDVDAVTKVLNGELLTQGPKVEEFESALCSFSGASFAISVNSATSALHLACLALDVQEGDIVWTSAITFVASANCARYCGADVDFVDIDPRTYNMSTSALETKLEIAKKAGLLPKVVIPVHLTGQPCDMEAIHKLSKIYGFSIIEDASHAIGAEYQSFNVGSGKFSDITVFSFHPVKIITTGEGGAAVTNSPELSARMRQLRSHGITRDPSMFRVDTQPSFYYEQQELGFNYRITDFQAALGLSQLERIDSFLSKRKEIAKKYNEKLENQSLILPYQIDQAHSSWHLYVIRVSDSNNPSFRNEVFEKLRGLGIGVNLHYIPVYRHPYYAEMGFDPKDYPEAESYYSQAISIPMHYELTDVEIDFVVQSIETLVP
jgi:UDP-4-amino-4,6-dideoxy-N-acetyl-beta-L-altrosamine transaminase